MASKLPAETDRLEAIRRLLVGLARGDDVFDLIDSVAELHPKHDTFPGEVYMGLGADALDIASATRDEPISYEGLREKYLPECEFRGKQNRKIQYAILTSASLRGGLERMLQLDRDHLLELNDAVIAMGADPVQEVHDDFIIQPIN